MEQRFEFGLLSRRQSTWMLPPPEWRLEAGHVHCWAAWLQQPDAVVEQFQKGLSKSELDRASRFRVRHARQRFIVSHGVLRRILAGYTGTAPEDLQFISQAFGKPKLADWLPPVFFNLSHSGAMALYAVSSSFEVGIDIEEIVPIAEADAIARQMFGVPEQSEMEHRQGRARDEVFYRAWTRKEAQLKCMGVGIGTSDHRFEGAFYELDPVEGYVAALAIASHTAVVRTWRWLDSPPGTRATNQNPQLASAISRPSEEQRARWHPALDLI